MENIHPILKIKIKQFNNNPNKSWDIRHSFVD